MDLKELAEKLQDKKAKQEAVKKKFSDREKVKKLTTEQRLDRIEELLGIK